MVDTSVDTDFADSEESDVDVTGLGDISVHDKTFSALEFDPDNE